MLPPWAADYLHEKWVTPWIWCMSQWSALLYYAKMFVWPSGLSIDHDFPYAMSLAEFRAWGSLVVIVVWITFALFVSRRRPHVAFATLWFFVTLAPESTFAALAEVVNDHRPYIASSLGLSVLAAWGLEKATSYTGSRRRDVYAVLVGLICIAAVTAGFKRTAQWAAEDSLWDATVQTSPNNGRAWMNSGLVEMRKGNLKEARRRFEKARQLVPVYPYLYMNLSTLELAEGNVKAAVDDGRQAVRFGPDLSRSHFYLGVALERQKSIAEALAEYRRACELDPKDTAACSSRERLAGDKASADSATAEAAMMGEGLRLLDEEHEAARAVDQFRALLAKNPDHYGATYQLARALDAAGRREEATQVWQRMLSMAQAAGDKDTESKVRDRLAASAP
jgi:tetratricopeptide (TPR) repeat protein